MRLFITFITPVKKYYDKTDDPFFMSESKKKKKNVEKKRKDYISSGPVRTDKTVQRVRESELDAFQKTHNYFHTMSPCCLYATRSKWAKSSS